MRTVSSSQLGLQGELEASLGNLGMHCLKREQNKNNIMQEDANLDISCVDHFITPI